MNPLLFFFDNQAYSKEDSSLWSLLDTTVAYRADYDLDSAGHHYAGKISHRPHQNRCDFLIGSVKEALVLKQDSDQVYILWPDRNFYITTSLHDLSRLIGGIDSLSLNQHLVGHDFILYERTNHYRLTGVFQGDIWMTHDHILLKAQGIVTFAGKETQISLSMTNLRRLSPDSSLFTIPKNYFGLPLDPKQLGFENIGNKPK